MPWFGNRQRPGQILSSTRSSWTKLQVTLAKGMRPSAPRRSRHLLRSRLLWPVRWSRLRDVKQTVGPISFRAIVPSEKVVPLHLRMEIVSFGPAQVVLQGSCLPPEGQLSQQTIACTAAELHEAFLDYWGPIWQRDVGVALDDIDHWSRFRDLLAGVEPSFPALQVRSFAPDLWRQTICSIGYWSLWMVPC